MGERNLGSKKRRKEVYRIKGYGNLGKECLPFLEKDSYGLGLRAEGKSFW